MSKRGERYHQVPTLWHMGYGKPFDIMRKRKGDTRWRRLFYSKLTKSSAMRWFKLSKTGACIIRRDIAREMFEVAIKPESWKQVQL